MDALTLFVVIIYALAVLRLTRLINADEITDPIRIAAARRFGPQSKLVYFLQCPWCVSMWLALGTAWIPAVATPLPLWTWPLLGLAVSHLAGLLAGLDGDDVEIEVDYQ